jgi:hypothetical protein
VTKSPARLARDIEAKNQKSRRDRLKSILLEPAKIVLAFLLGSAIGQPLLSRIWSPDATLLLQGIGANSCTAYLLIFGHDGNIDGASFSVRFPGKLNGIKVGIPENLGTDPNNYMQAFVGDWNPNTCTLGPGGNQLDVTGVTVGSAGNTAFVRVGTLLEKTPVMGEAIVLSGVSAMSPAPTRPELQGAYSYNLFGVSIQRRIRFLDRGITVAKK